MTLPTNRNKTIGIVSATVFVRRHGTDKVSLKTDLVSPIWNPPEQQDQPKLELYFDVSKGKGADYVREIFGIEPKVIEEPAFSYQFKKGK